jgi:glycosyltransferase involved in cell wall biosynthesis
MGVSKPPENLISAIVPTCDRPALLRQALASIRAIEGPDLKFEILVGDNGAMPQTRAVAEEFGAIYLQARKRGPSAARNVCLRAATAPYLAFLDDDDVWLPETVRPHRALLEARPHLDAVLGQAIYADPDLVRQGPPWPADPPGAGDDLVRKMLSGFFPQIGTTVARSAVRNTIGEFDEKLIGGEDLDWLLRMAHRNTLGYTATPCILFRGRPAGVYDSLQILRLGYDRRVFFRHAIHAWRVWRSPREFMLAYSQTLEHFYRYFVDAAAARVVARNYPGALKAALSAFRVFPLRATLHFLVPRQLRQIMRLARR